MDPLEWVALADRLLEAGGEAELRTATGRYYFAVFVKSRDSLERDGLLSPARSDADHRGVVTALREARRGVAALNLDRLRRARNLADYETDTRFERVDVDRARELAQEIIRLCSPDWDKPAEPNP